ncbi:S-Ena type endospore appendage [Cohnella sp. GCM10020058]|uniref:S-Ena type endospore appendage n=1 Tax=Cohnella sp. GCM10020058 TaxID=3317330 RepID=UPI00362F45B7
MRKTIQVNKQTTIVVVDATAERRRKARCRRPVRRRGRRRRFDPGRRAYYEEICGAIFQKCDSQPQVYFRAIEMQPSATIKLQNDTNCVMAAIIKMRTKEIVQLVGQSQQISLVLPSISSLTIRCSGEDAAQCRGSYIIRFRRG